jgi:hypothetical protein
MAEIDIPIGLRGSADAEHDNIRRIEGLLVERRGLEPSRGNIVLNQVLEAGLKKRRLRLLNRLHFICVAVDPEYAVANFSKTRGTYAADISQPHYNYVLFVFQSHRSCLVQGEFIMEVGAFPQGQSPR